ncbi:hypothetical protein BX666DRAFT_1934279 [Dichotomocladium elegans]|nr:hypothetical protein BX666DRAFT_1934279 [Dichotomocladium elegans]
MAFLKATMTSEESDQTMALDALSTTYDMANAQINAPKTAPNVGVYFPGYYHYFGKKRSNDKPPTSPASEHIAPPLPSPFPSNGILRAHVIKAESCLLTAVIQLLQESVMSYVKCGVNLRRAYVSYSFVWQQYKAMGESYKKYMDSDTVSGVQFGIGSLHLVMSALPGKLLKAISVLGWKPDKKLGFSLLNECAVNKRIRSPMATVMLLAYYSATTSFAPQILSDTYIKPAMETLLEAQQDYPNSAVYLFLAGRISRLGLDLPLSTRSFLYAADMTRNDWAEAPVSNACQYEIVLNHMITGNWEHAASSFESLCDQKYWSSAFCKYMQGACLEMLGKRPEAILAFAQVPSLVVKKMGDRMGEMDSYALRKVQAFQTSGYQDMDYYVPALEFMCIWNLFHYMDRLQLEQCHRAVNKALEAIQIEEQEQYDLRCQELAPESPPPDHFDQRATLLLIKSSIQNVAGLSEENTILLNWIVDHKECFVSDSWVVPFALWEAGVTAWQIDNKNRSRYLWEMALGHSKYDFEYRLAVRLSLVLARAEELGFAEPTPQPVDNKKRFSISLPAMTSRASMQ